MESRRIFTTAEILELADEQGVPFDRWPQFARCLNNGCAPRLAAMLATRSFPGFATNDTFMAGGRSGEQLAEHPAMYGHFAQMAEAEGVSVCGKKYLHGLARFPGDPEAWVSGKDDVARVLKERGWSSTGAVEYTPPEPDAPDDDAYRVAPDILDRAVASEIGHLDMAEAAKVEPDVRDRLSRALSGQSDDHPLRVSGVTPAEAEVDWGDG
jgi:hypothetical protein